MTRITETSWLHRGAILIVALIMAAGLTRAPATDAVRDHPPVAALSTPSAHLPSPFLAATGLAAELPAAELGLQGPQPGSTTRSTDPITTATDLLSATASRIRGVQLSHDTFAAANLAARAGLLSSRSTAPPPPLG